MDQISEQEKVSKRFRAEADKLKADIDAKIETKNDELELMEGRCLDANQRLKSLLTQCRDAQAELDEWSINIQEQEHLIDDAVEEGNLRLRELRYQIEPLKEVKVSLQGEISSLESKKADLLISADSVQQSLDKQITDTQTVIARYNDEVFIAQAQLVEVTSMSKKSDAEILKKLTILKEKEEALIAKQHAYEADYASLQTEKRRWDSTKSLYGLE